MTSEKKKSFPPEILALDEQIEFGKKNGISTTNLVLLRGRKKPFSPNKETSR